MLFQQADIKVEFYLSKEDFTGTTLSLPRSQANQQETLVERQKPCSLTGFPPEIVVIKSHNQAKDTTARVSAVVTAIEPASSRKPEPLDLAASCTSPSINCLLRQDGGEDDMRSPATCVLVHD
ncbi:hypothetical protein PFLUV_G00165510 [Perca fluviatilis]|uniref:Uncharacterized protein n=1 Tax=Perca fluviatilis TaxID=8168 RepID=A0A6A5EY52_PERFL|nr:hypothetical protein PFLUV_G00165510 [Perca fluviatilis]